MKKLIGIRFLLFIIVGVALVLISSCNKDEEEDDNNPPNIAIGDNYAGGIIFYIDGTGQHGLVAALSDQSSGGWGCEGTLISGTGSAIGTGQANTASIVIGCSEAGTCARICNDLDLNGYTDWFLPSKDELNLMYQKLHMQGLGNFTENIYWSSTEVDDDEVWVQNFWDDNPWFLPGAQFIIFKDGLAPVRAVRAF